MKSARVQVCMWFRLGNDYRRDVFLRDGELLDLQQGADVAINTREASEWVWELVCGCEKRGGASLILDGARVMMEQTTVKDWRVLDIYVNRAYEAPPTEEELLDTLAALATEVQG